MTGQEKEGKRIGKEDSTRIKRMEQEAIRQLLHYHEKDKKQRLKDMIKKAAGRYVPPVDVIFWPTGLIANALMEQALAENDEESVSYVRAYFDRWISEGMKIYYVDDALCGTALIDLFKRTGEEKYKKGADKLAEYLLQMESRHADAVGSIPYRPAQGNGHVYVDGIGMMCPFLMKYGITFQQQNVVETAFKQIENMLTYGMDEATGLPYHGFQYENRIKYGIIGWGRAVGWLMLGMAGVLKELRDAQCIRQEAEYKRIEEAFTQLIQAIAPYQKPNGAFCWQLSALDGPEDSSATAMIAWALQMAGQTQEMSILERAVPYLLTCEKDGKIYNCSGECLGFSQYPQVYGAYPWSLGPAYAVIAKAERKETI